MNVSLSGLRAFEVAARLQSFQAAAQELNLSPTAVSHRIRGLEAALGRELFVRSARKVALTTEGAELARTLRPAFRAIDEAVDRFMVAPNRQTVTLGVGPIFAARWLAKRLGAFLSHQPGTDLRIHHTPLPVVLQMDRYDIAIAWGDGRWPGLTATPIMAVSLSPVHAPGAAFVPAAGLTLETLEQTPLLHQRDREDWRAWLTLAGADPHLAARGTVVEDTNVLLQAIMSGQGIGLGVFPLVADEIASQTLIRPWPQALSPSKAYHVVHAPDALERPPVRALRDWLVAKTRRSVSPDED